MTEPFGLYNTGVVCYFNSAIQALLSCEPFVKYVMSCNSKSVIIHEIKNLIEHHEKYNMDVFNAFMAKKSSPSFGFGQEDATELLSLLIEAIDDKYITSMFTHVYTCDIFCMQCRTPKEIKKDSGIIMNVDIDSVINNSVGEPDHPLTKFVKNNYSKCYGFECKCGSQKLIKTNRLVEAPEVLIISFDKYQEKKMYDYPSYMEFMNSKTHENHRYKLVSVIHHNGNQNSGHYYSTCLRDRWYELNDLSILPCEYPEPCLNAYVVVYQFIGTDEHSY